MVLSPSFFFSLASESFLDFAASASFCFCLNASCRSFCFCRLVGVIFSSLCSGTHSSRYEAKVQALQKEDGVIQYCIHYKGWNKTWDECVPEQRLLKMTPTNLQKQKDLQLASKQKQNEAEVAKSKKESDAKLKKNEGDSTIKVKKTDIKGKRTVVDGQKLSNTELGASKQQRSGTPPVGGKRSSSSGGNKKGSSSSRGSKRRIEEGECAIKELRLNVPRLKKLKSRSTSESSSASEDLSAKSKRRPQRAAALAPKVKIGEVDDKEELTKRKQTSKIRASTPDLAKKQELAQSKEKDIPAFGSEIELPLPESLKDVLVDDFDLISRQRKTLMLPARTSVADFLQSFSEDGKKEVRGGRRRHLGG